MSEKGQVNWSRVQNKTKNCCGETKWTNTIQFLFSLYCIRLQHASSHCTLHHLGVTSQCYNYREKPQKCHNEKALADSGEKNTQWNIHVKWAKHLVDIDHVWFWTKLHCLDTIHHWVYWAWDFNAMITVGQNIVHILNATVKSLGKINYSTFFAIDGK